MKETVTTDLDAKILRKHADEIAYLENMRDTKQFPIWGRSTNTMLNRIINILEGVKNV